MSHAHYTLIHKPQHRPSKHTSSQRAYCHWCRQNNNTTSEHPWEQYETICSNPYAIQILTDKTSLSRQAVLNSMMNNSKNTNKNPKMIQDSTATTATERMAVAVGRKSKGRKRVGRGYDDEMDLDQARLINWEADKNFERRDVIFEENEPTMDEVVHGEYLRTIFPSFRERVEDAALGGVVTDQELRDMGLLYDSDDEHEHFMETQEPATPVACTPYMTPRSPVSDSDLDELWELVEGRRLPVEMRGEWDILSEF
ncbi:hypothetical protein TWF281_011772 [Arthrobotrys megalospora]